MVRYRKAALIWSLISLSVIFSAVCLNLWAATDPDPNSQPIYLDRGAAGLSRWLAAIRTRASILMVTAHPDDEDGGMLALQSRGLGARATLLTLTRGEGGQNAMSGDLYDELALVRTQELLTADRYYGVDQYWGRAIDYGFSKTREEALDKWGYDRTLSDVVRVIRMTRPLVITSVFIGAPTDGHGNHQVSGQMAQEAFLAAGDPNRFPEQIAEGLRPWSPVKVYARTPFFQPTKEGTIYDYATDKYVPIRFRDYVNQTWINEKPKVNVKIPEGTLDPPVGLTYAQMGREGWGFQKSQNGGGTLPLPSFVSVTYHRYGSRVQTADEEKSFYDGIDISLSGIVTLAKGNTESLRTGLSQLSELADSINQHYRPESPSQIAPDLAKGLALTRSLIKQVEASGLGEPGKGDVLFELKEKERQFEKALILSLGITFDAAVAPAKESTGPFAGTSPTFTIAIPGQSFGVQTALLNTGTEAVNVENVDLKATDGKNWSTKAEGTPAPQLPPSKDLRLKFTVAVPNDAALTRPYFSRPNQEQPYYDLNDARYRNLSYPPYPLEATARVTYGGTELVIRKVVQTHTRIEGIGLVDNPLLVGPALSVSVSPAAGAMPLEAKSFEFSCTLHSNIKGTAKGTLKLHLPDGWTAAPNEYPFAFSEDGENETVAFQVTPHSVKTETYQIKAAAQYNGKTYEEGYEMVGYSGLRPYPYYRPATYTLTGVNVKTAPNLRIGFLPGTGDDLPQALQDLGLSVQILSGADIETGNLSGFDAIVLGVRAYAVRPDLRSANNRLLNYVKNGGTLIVQYNLQNFDRNYGPYPFTLGSNPEKVVDEFSAVKFPDPNNPALTWPNKITASDFAGWQEERGHGFMKKWDPQYKALIETHDPGQDPQAGGLLVAHYGRGFYVYDAFALYRQLPAGVPGAYRILANLVSLSKNPEWK
ncbi:MAG: PIG-L family deacetylase [Acidobacteriaceae bacterium]|nr:PIG-L family deacetylase [Acidobacteriaceae bacterium]